MEIAFTCLEVGGDGRPGDSIKVKTAKTLSVYHGRTTLEPSDLGMAVEMALQHRVRRQPLQELAMDVQALRRIWQ